MLRRAGVPARALPIALAALIVLAAHATAQDVTVRVIEEPYRPVYAFLGIYFETLGSQPAEQGGTTVNTADQLGLGLKLMSAKRTNLQLDLGFEFRQVDTKGATDPDKISVFNTFMGGRFYPLEPTFALGNLAVRLTLAAHGGLAIGDAFGPAVDFSGGFAISSGTDPNGLTVEIVGRPVEYTIEDLDEILPDVVLSRSWTLRAGFLFGPG